MREAAESRSGALEALPYAVALKGADRRFARANPAFAGLASSRALEEKTDAHGRPRRVSVGRIALRDRPTSSPIVQQRGGHVRVDSMPGKGTTFQRFLPATKEGTHG